MKLSSRVTPALALVLVGLLAPPALAQSGGSTVPPIVPPGPSAADGGDLDLPVGRPGPRRAPPEPVDEEEPPVIYGEELPADGTIIYVIDISGSMAWDRQSYVGLDGQTTVGTKLDRAKVELIRSVSALPEEFRFDVVAYDCGTRVCFGELRDASGPNKARAASWIGTLRAGGATGTGPATATALGVRENDTVVLLSDGAPNCGASGIAGHRRMILSSNAQGARIHCFGIAAAGTFRQFLVGVASATGGKYVDVP